MGELQNGVKFVLPLCSIRRLGILNSVHSVYDGCYGGLIADGPLSEVDYAAIWKQIPIAANTNFALVCVPGSDYDCPRPDFETDCFLSSEVWLEGLTFEEVYKKFTKSRKEDYRRGVKHDLQFRPADYTNLSAEFDILYDLYAETVEKRWKGDVLGDILDRGYLEKFQKVVEKYPNNFHLWFVELDGEPISMATAFDWNKRLDGWIMASRPEYFKIKPAVFILTNILQFATENDYRLFHFGPNGDNTGLVDFKRRFGADTVSYQTWFKQSPLHKLLSKLSG